MSLNKCHPKLFVGSFHGDTVATILRSLLLQHSDEG